MPLTATLVLAAMLAWAPTTTAADLRRYQSIAEDIDAVAEDPAEQPVVRGLEGRARTALLLASTAFSESMYRADVDDGRVRGDHNHSVCVMQIQVHGRTGEGWSADDLLRDRKKCVRAALHLVRGSISWCMHLTDGDRLGGYTHGRCIARNRIARERWQRAFDWPVPRPAEPPSSVRPPSVSEPTGLAVDG